MRSSRAAATFLSAILVIRSISERRCSALSIGSENAYYEDDGICDSVKCNCDLTTKTLSCHRLIFEFLPIFPKWVEILELNDNHLTMLRDNSFVNLTNLKRLDFSGNDLEYLSPRAFAGLKNLETLDLSNNRLSLFVKETFRDLRKLSSLNLSKNQFNDLSSFDAMLFTTTTTTTTTNSTTRIFDEFNFGYNRFIRCENPSFRWPRLRRLSLTGAKFYAFTGTGLILASNDDESSQNKSVRLLDVFENLEEFDAAECEAEITSEFFDRIRNVVRLNIAENHITSAVLSKQLVRMHRLEYLNVSRIRTDINEWRIFPPAIKELDVSNLKLISVNFDDFSPVTDLETLRVSSNRITDFALPAALVSLRRLDLSKNLLTQFPRSSSASSKRIIFTRLEYLDLSDNQISVLNNVSLSYFPSITTLIMGGNRLLNVDKGALTLAPELRTLDLSDNALTHLHTLRLALLNTLNVSNNRINRVDLDFFAALPSLTTLDMSNNKNMLFIASAETPMTTAATGTATTETTLPRRELVLLDATAAAAAAIVVENPQWFENVVDAKRLRHVNLARVGLRRFPRNFFAILTNLGELNVDGNYLDAISWDEAVASAPRSMCVKTLRLASNHLTRIDNTTLLRNPCLEFLDASRNPFTCDCRLQPLLSVLKSLPLTERNLYNETLYYCFSPQASNWRYPLYEVLNTLQPCNNAHAPFNALTMLLYIFVALVSTVFAAVFCRLCVVAVRKGVLHSQYIYRPLQLFTEDPTNLVQL